MDDRWPAWAGFVTHVLDAPGRLTPERRRRLFDLAAGDSAAPAEDDLARLAETVAAHAYRVTDDQVTGLTRDHGEDEVFEAVVVSAAGAADRRLRALRRAMGTG